MLSNGQNDEECDATKMIIAIQPGKKYLQTVWVLLTSNIELQTSNF